MIGIKNVRVVLVRPRIGRNVGAVCRAMKTMGITDLSIVSESKESPLDLVEARKVAVHASDVLEAASFYDAISDAVGDSAVVAGVTRRRGRWRKYFSLMPEELADRIARNVRARTALLFGNEESGLTDEELGQCDLAVHVPSSPLFPSLNLSHAVQIVSYEIHRRMQRSTLHPYTPINRQKLDSLIEITVRSLANIGFFKQVGPEEMSIFLRGILGRAQLSGREAKRIEKIFRKISGLCAGRGVEQTGKGVD
jgi:tRNA/rRNA methyltransferase